MKASIRFQFKSGWVYALTTLCLLLLFIPYSFILGAAPERRPVTYMASAVALLLMMGFVQMMVSRGSLLRVCLGYGETRRGWLAGSVVYKLGYTVVTVLGCVLVALPLSSLIFGQPVRLRTDLLPILLGLTFLFACGGDLFGYVVARYGAKVMMACILGSVLLFVAAVVLLLLLVGLETLTSVLRSPWAAALSLLLALAVQAACWPLVRRIPAA